MNQKSSKMKKTLNNTTENQAKDQVSDLEVWGEGDKWKLISKASSKREGWMKSTKALEIDGYGSFVQVSTQQGENVAEAITFVPNLQIYEKKVGGVVVDRYLDVDSMVEEFSKVRYDGDKD
jgi:hypothetical protein